jgi:hypothetical protein
LYHPGGAHRRLGDIDNPFGQPHSRHYLRRQVMLITYIYQLLTFLVLALVVGCLFREKSLNMQIVACMVLLPLALRVLMIK